MSKVAFGVIKPEDELVSICTNASLFSKSNLQAADVSNAREWVNDDRSG